MEFIRKTWSGGQLLQTMMTIIYPPRCLLCQRAGRNGQDICDDCYQHLPWNKYSCKRCALPLSYHNENEVLCGRCQTKLPYFDSAKSVFCYHGDVINMVHQLKFTQHLVYSRLMGEFLMNAISEAIKVSGERPDLLLPVPLHKKRLRQRGFNQSIELARKSSKKLNIPLDTRSLIRCRETEAQTGLNAKQRQNNIKGAFELVHVIKAKHIAIVDDVITTGSTVNEIARVLKRSGVKRVDVYSFARA